MIDRDAYLRFNAARIAVIGEESYAPFGKIGTLAEKSQHRMIKYYIEADASKHEIPIIGRSIADIKNQDGIFEIQTRGMEKLRPKLGKFLPLSPLTIVLPLASKKTLRWLDQETGELSEPRKSPKSEDFWYALRELYKIREFLQNGNLKIKLLYLNVEEYRYLNGWDKTGKKGSTRIERIPLELLDEYDICGRDDVVKMLPDTLKKRFSAKELSSAARFSPRMKSYIIGTLCSMGIISRVDKRGREYIYEITA